MTSAEYPARLDVAYPERLSRGLVWVKWWLLAIPQYLVVAVFTGGAGPRYGGVIGILCLIAGVTLAVTRRYPRPSSTSSWASAAGAGGSPCTLLHAGRVPAVPARHRTGRGPVRPRRTPSGTVDPRPRDLVVTLLFAVFLIAHGLVHLAIYAAPVNRDQPVPFVLGRSWALGGDRTTTATRSGSVALACAVAAAYSAAGWMLAINATTWAAVAGIAAVLGLVLKGVWFHPWLTFGVAIDIAIAVTVLVGGRRSLGRNTCSPPNRSPASSPSPASPSWEPRTRRATSGVRSTGP